MGAAAMFNTDTDRFRFPGYILRRYMVADERWLLVVADISRGVTLAMDSVRTVDLVAMV